MTIIRAVLVPPNVFKSDLELHGAADQLGIPALQYSHRVMMILVLVVLVQMAGDNLAR